MNVRLAAFILALVVSANGFAQSTPVPVQHRRLVHELLKQSLQYELKALEAEESTHYGMRNEYITQLWRHGRVGAFDNAVQLTAAIMKKHEERNRDRSQAYYEQHNRRYRDLTSTADGLADLIRLGSLEKVRLHLQSAALVSQTKGKQVEAPFDNFWVSCKLAVAYFNRGELEKSRESLNLARRLREGGADAGRQFDADDDWLPEMPEGTIGFGIASADQSRATFLATLIQSGHSEVAIQWFLARNGKPKVPAHNVWSSAFENTRRFVGWVARYSSSKRAREVANSVFGKDVPAETYAAIIEGGLARGELSSVNTIVDQAIAGLQRPTAQWGHGWNSAIEALAKHKKFALADRLQEAVVNRLAKHVAARLAGEPATLASSLWDDGLASPYLGMTIARINTDAAARLVSLFERMSASSYGTGVGKRRADSQFDLVRVRCGIESKLTVPRAAGSMWVPELIDVYIDTQQMKKARELAKQASDRIRLTTSSGASVGGNGLAVMGSNPHMRIRLARRAVRLNDLALARKLIDEIPQGYARREGYRAITLRIAEHFGQHAAQNWLNETTDGLSKSGGSMGLVEFLVPIPDPTDEIPKPWARAC